MFIFSLSYSSFVSRSIHELSVCMFQSVYILLCVIVVIMSYCSYITLHKTQYTHCVMYKYT